MKVDRRSLIDLGVLSNAAGEWPLGRLLDHTHSRASLDALKSLLLAPLDDPAEIAARQRLLRELPTALMHVTWPTLMAHAKDVAGFLDSNYVVFPSARVDAAMFVIRHRDIVDYLEQHLLVVSQLLEQCHAIRERLRPVSGDARYHALVDDIDIVVADPLRTALRVASVAGATRRAQLCALDRAVRVSHTESLRQLLRAVYELDAYHALAIAASTPGMTFPIVSADPAARLSVQTLRHPLLARGIPNTIDLPRDERVMFVTGPNMAGKSTLLRALGITVYFAHLGLPVSATAATVPLTDRLISSLGVEDSIARGESLYLAEVRRVKAVVKAVVDGERVVALLDEVFRGTNAKDAIDATGLLVDGLSNAHCGCFVIASHLIEVAESRRGQGRVGWWCMRVGAAPGSGSAAFTYRLERGISDVRLGMKLLETEGVVGLLARVAERVPDTESPRAALS